MDMRAAITATTILIPSRTCRAGFWRRKGSMNTASTGKIRGVTTGYILEINPATRERVTTTPTTMEEAATAVGTTG
jgi:hypothetical protein